MSRSCAEFTSMVTTHTSAKSGNRALNEGRYRCVSRRTTATSAVVAATRNTEENNTAALAYNLSASVCICTSRAAFTSHTFGMGRGLLDRVAKCAHRLVKCQVVSIVRSHDMGPSPSCHEHLHISCNKCGKTGQI